MCPNCSVSLTLHRGRTAGALPLLRPRDAHARRLRRRASGAYLRLTRLRDGEGRGGRGGRAARGAASSGWTGTARRRRGVLQQTLAAFEQGEIDILVGTQMIAKGHDFPRVTLVGVVDADVGLGHAGLPLGRAHVPAADAGRRPRGARRDWRAR